MSRFLLPYTLAVFCAIFVAFILPIISPTYSYSDENDLIEKSTSYLLWFAAISALFAYTKTKQSILKISSVLFVFGAMREMDWHTKFTSQSILKSRFYLNSNTPDFEKLIGVLIILILIFTIIKFLKELYSCRKDIKNYSMPFVVLFLAISLFITGKFFDGIFRYIPELKIYRNDFSDTARMIEEILEFLGAIALTIFPYILWRHEQKIRDEQNLNPIPAHRD